VTKATARETAKRTMTASHEKALAEGPSLSAIVDAYFAAINLPKKRGRRFRKPSSRSVSFRLGHETSLGGRDAAEMVCGVHPETVPLLSVKDSIVRGGHASDRVGSRRCNVMDGRSEVSTAFGSNPSGSPDADVCRKHHPGEGYQPRAD
jgi:hypothetical protein